MATAQAGIQPRQSGGRRPGLGFRLRTWWHGLLEGLGGPARRGVLVLLAIAALAAGVVIEALSLASWRRPTVRAELRRSLRQCLARSLGTILITAALVGFGMVYQALVWLSYAGQDGLTGRVVVTVLFREVAPVLVGLILLGRSGTVTIVEFGEIKASGQLRLLEAQGLDPFQLLLLPRAIAFVLAAFTLGIIFLAAALAVGVLAAALVGQVENSAAEFIAMIIEATGKRDFILLPVKLGLIGLLVALAAAVTGFSSTPQEKPSHLLPRGFVRGLLAVLSSSALLSIAVA